MVELQIDDSVRADIARVCASAAQFPLNFTTFTKLSKLKPQMRARQLVDRPHREVLVPFGYKVGFEIADVRPERPCRHLIVVGPGPLPELAAVARIMKEFSFRRSLHQVMTWLEKVDAGRQCVHVVEPVD